LAETSANCSLTAAGCDGAFEPNIQLNIKMAGEPLLFVLLVGDLLRAIARLLPDEDRLCARLACSTLRDHAAPLAASSHRVAFLRTRSLAAYACDSLPGFMLADALRMLALAASVGCVGVLAELMDARGGSGQPDPSGRVCRAAASRGQLEALSWLHARGCPWNEDTCSFAAAGGFLEVVRYAHEHGCPWDNNTCHIAAIGGHLDVLRYAREHGCPWVVGLICNLAAQGGHLEVLRYAHEQGCPWDAETCAFAALKGHLEMLRYAHERGCPWDARICARAAARGHLEMLQYAREHGCPG